MYEGGRAVEPRKGIQDLVENGFSDIIQMYTCMIYNLKVWIFISTYKINKLKSFKKSQDHL